MIGTRLALRSLARSKVLAEDFITRNANQYFVMRAGWMMGGGPAKDKKFVGKIIKQIVEGNNELFIVMTKMVLRRTLMTLLR